jgi:serine/threonine protein kinase
MSIYNKIQRVGQGGMSVVDLVKRTRDSAEFARKSIQRQVSEEDDEWEKTRRRFLREIRLLSEVKHPHVVRILDFQVEGDHLWYIMPYFKNGSLANRLHNYRGDLRSSLEAFKHLANTLLHLHSLDNPIIHRDLNPNNILIDEKNTLIISDFGISVSLQRKTTVLSTTQGWGTVGYTAPEQWADMANADQRADVYSLGVILHELFTGAKPIGRVSDEFPPEYRNFVARLIRQDREERTGSMLSAIRHLDLIELKKKEMIPQERIQNALGLARSAKNRELSDEEVTEILDTMLTYQDEEAASVEIYMELPVTKLAQMSESLPEKFLEATRQFISKISNGGLPFEYCDPVARRLFYVFRNVVDSDIKAMAFAKLVTMGEGHNRFYVMDRYVELAKEVSAEHDVLSVCRGLKLAKDYLDPDRLQLIVDKANDPTVSEEARQLLPRKHN